MHDDAIASLCGRQAYGPGCLVDIEDPQCNILLILSIQSGSNSFPSLITRISISTLFHKKSQGVVKPRPENYKRKICFILSKGYARILNT
jgi:hypothetical protein